MKFWNFFKKFLIFTAKEIYSFFLKLSLSIFIICKSLKSFVKIWIFLYILSLLFLQSSILCIAISMTNYITLQNKYQ